MLEYAEEYHPATFKEVDGKRKRVMLTEQEIEEKWSNPDWKVGDRVSQHQREFRFEIIATAPSCVLMRQEGGQLVVDSSKNLEAYYRRERTEEGW